MGALVSAMSHGVFIVISLKHLISETAQRAKRKPIFKAKEHKASSASGSPHG